MLVAHYLTHLTTCNASSTPPSLPRYPTLTTPPVHPSSVGIHRTSLLHVLDGYGSPVRLLQRHHDRTHHQSELVLTRPLPPPVTPTRVHVLVPVYSLHRS